MEIMGTPDEDSSLIEALMQAVEGKEVVKIVHISRVPKTARMCLLPGSCKVQAHLKNGVIVTALQTHEGGRVFIKES